MARMTGGLTTIVDLLRPRPRPGPDRDRRGRGRRRRRPPAALERDRPLHRVPRRRPRAGRRQGAAGEHLADVGRRRLRPDLRRAASPGGPSGCRTACPTCCSRCWSPTSGPRPRPRRCGGSAARPVTEARTPRRSLSRARCRRTFDGPFGDAEPARDRRSGSGPRRSAARAAGGRVRSGVLSAACRSARSTVATTCSSSAPPCVSSCVDRVGTDAGVLAKGLVADDRRQPLVAPRRLAQRRASAPGAKQGVLGYVLRLARILGVPISHAQTDPVCLTPLPAIARCCLDARPEC